MSALEKQIAFLLEIDKVKTIIRRTRLLDNTRYENDAEHSWHLAVMAVILAPYANDSGLNVLKVLKMVLIHDLVEIDAGDTYLYDDHLKAEKARKEALAAERIFGLLPSPQKEELHALWEEFEARQTSEALFAASLDRLEPLLQNYHTDGYAWKEHGIVSTQVYKANEHIQKGSQVLWAYAKDLIDRAVQEGKLKKGSSENI
ncbi:MAG: HD domain-containing protein [Candidatus Firestonebacteria bacterium]|nr:HD domain-containing protein [Candidatus Firestonebacteria bacterium]